MKYLKLKAKYGSVTGGYTEFPWHARIEADFFNNNSINYKAGSIITEYFILTAAEPFLNAKSIKVSMGSVYRSKPKVTVYASKFYPHPYLDLTTHKSNIGLIKLPYKLTTWVPGKFEPVRLMSRSDAKLDFVALGNETHVSGFGCKFRVPKLFLISQ